MIQETELYTAKNTLTGEIKFFSTAGALRIFLRNNQEWRIKQ